VRHNRDRNEMHEGPYDDGRTGIAPFNHGLDRRRFLGNAVKLALAPALAQALSLGSVGRAFAQAPATDQTLRLAFTNPTVAFDTGREGGTPELHLLLFDGLTFYNWETHVTEPVIASSWDYDPNTLTYIFHLRDDVKWTTGATVTAADFEWTWKRNLSPELASPNVSFLGYIKNAVSYNSGTAAAADVGVTALDDRTLQVVMEQPTPFFPMITSLWPFFPLPRAVIESVGDDKWMEPENIQSVGPFVFERWDHDQQMVFRRNETYWGKRPTLEHVIYRLYQNASQQALASYEADELDFAPVAPAETDRVLADSKLSTEVVHWPESRNWQLRIDHRNPNTVLKNVNVRKALYLAIDRDLIVKQLIKGQGVASLNFVPPDIPGNNPGAALPGGPAEAKQFMATAGYPGGQGFPGFKLGYVPTQAEGVLVSQALVSMWKDVLGINVELLAVPTDWRTRIRTEPYDMYYGGWGSDYLDPNDWHNVIFEGDYWQSHYTDPTYLDMIKKANLEPDPTVRNQKYADAESYLIKDQMVTIPIFFGATTWVQKPWVRSLRIAPLNTYIDSRDAWIGAH
jgi:oligopeptide transport system substrate-binding protein